MGRPPRDSSPDDCREYTASREPFGSCRSARRSSRDFRRRTRDEGLPVKRDPIEKFRIRQTDKRRVDVPEFDEIVWIEIAIATGAREGELLALRMSDIIDDYRTIRIRRTLSDSKYGNPCIKNHPKTGASRRDVSLPELARKAVLDELTRRENDGRQSHELLFSTQEGTFHLRQNVLSRYFRPILKKAELPSMTIHDLRHTYATLALNAGVGVHIVSKMLGHASVSVTIDLYGHALPDARREAAVRMNAVLS